MSESHAVYSHTTAGTRRVILSFLVPPPFYAILAVEEPGRRRLVYRPVTETK